METRVFEIELKDGRIWRVNCINSSQIKRFNWAIDKIKDSIKEVRVITNGIHNISDFEKIINNLKK